METISVFENIEAIKIEKPIDKIILQLKGLITSGQLQPGDRLPPERILAEKFGVGRGHVREAILKMEFYGLVKTSPQSGTYVSGYSLKILDSIFTDIINFNKDDFPSLVEARYYLEINAARLAAERRNEDDIVQMKDALKEYDANTVRGIAVVQEDMLFHLKIAAATKNSVIESMLVILVPDLIKFLIDNNICHNKRNNVSMAEHHQILDAIIKQDADAAAEAMKIHLSEMMDSRSAFK